MISRDEFVPDFLQRLRKVLQGNEREMAARRRVASASDVLTAEEYEKAVRALGTANMTLDAAILELADWIFDRLEEKAPLEPCT